MLGVVSLTYAEKSGSITEVVNPFIMQVEGQQMYIVEGPNIYIYTLRDFKLQKKFGKAGEGPREFRLNPTANMGNAIMDVYPDYILINSLGKLSYFKRDGEYIKEMTTGRGFGVFIPLGNKFLGFGSAVEDGIEYRTINIYNSKLDERKEFFRQKMFVQWEKGYFNLLEIVGPFFYVCDNKIFIEKNKDSVSVFDNEGKFLHTLDINKDYKKLKFTKRDKEKFMDFVHTDPIFKKFFQDMRDKMKFPEYYPGIQFFHLENNKIYIIRWTKDKDGKSEIWEFDLKGNILKKAWVPFFEKDAITPYAYSIDNGKFYQLVEDIKKEGKWDLYMTEIK
jgi:hypothetical protein